MTMRRLAVSLVATGLLVGLAGCGGDSNDASTDASNTSAPDGAALLTKETFAQEVVAGQTSAGSAHIEATVEMASESFEMSGDVAGLGDADAMEMDATATVQSVKMRLLIVEKVLYIEGEQFAPEGKKWLSIDLTDPSNPISQIFDAANPANFTAYLEGITDLKDKGAATVDGVETRHYSITVDTAEMLKSHPMFKGQDASTLGLPAELTSDVYVDSNNRLVQLKVTMGGSGSFEVHFSDYGKDVSVEAPDPSTVGEFSL